MKTTAILGILAALLTVAPTYAATHERDTSEERFFAAIDRGDLAGVMAMLHPDARQLADAPVLEAWMDAIRARLGEHEQIQVLEHKSERRLTGVREQTRSTVTFQRGTVESGITVLDGKIIAFQVSSPQMAEWFQGPTTVEPYDAAAKAFIRAFLDGRAVPAREMMHPVLQKEIPLDRLEEMINKVCANGSALKQLSLRDHRFSLEGSAPALFLTYSVECEQATGTCEVEFQFVGMKGHLLGFWFQ